MAGNNERRIMALHNGGLRPAQIERETGLSRNTVRRALRVAGIGPQSADTRHGGQVHADAATERDGHLADIIAEYDCTLAAAARSAGISKSAAQRGWQRILTRLGEQAA